MQKTTDESIKFSSLNGISSLDYECYVDLYSYGIFGPRFLSLDTPVSNNRRVLAEDTVSGKTEEFSFSY